MAKRIIPGFRATPLVALVNGNTESGVIEGQHNTVDFCYGANAKARNGTQALFE